ncbi:Resolvase-like protein [Aequoribacter fuscus]|uniref:Resolvase-like protein n=1 Tax=Aequoribacter fuscus TaxID=2518989 RepID=F3L2C5_9GAMM|nr:Resolvase-like protein [Aequoribacter fuscus]
MNVLLLSMLGAVYQFEREIMRERQREGIAAAKTKGKFTGRKKTINDDEIIRLVNKGKCIREAADVLGISMSSVQRAKRSFAM